MRLLVDECTEPNAAGQLVTVLKWCQPLGEQQ